jgi:CHRD domain
MMSKKIAAAAGALAVTGALILVAGLPAAGRGEDDGGRKALARLNGYKEVPSISTTGAGRFEARLDKDDNVIRYTLAYRDLEGDAQAAHIHLGQTHTEGGVIAFLCGGGTTDPCPDSGAVTGVIAASDILGPAGQGLEPGNMAEALRALAAGATYANVHTDLWPEGEIRGQISVGGRNRR